MDFSYDRDGNVSVAVSKCHVKHAVNVEGHRPYGRYLTEDEIDFIAGKIDMSLLTLACNLNDGRLCKSCALFPDVDLDEDCEDCEHVPNDESEREFHRQTFKIVEDMKLDLE
jgi:hypothetical protein